MCVLGRAKVIRIFVPFYGPFSKEPSFYFEAWDPPSQLEEITETGECRQVSSYDRLWSDLLSKFRAGASVWWSGPCAKKAVRLGRLALTTFGDAPLAGASFERSTISPCPWVGPRGTHFSSLKFQGGKPVLLEHPCAKSWPLSRVLLRTCLICCFSNPQGFWWVFVFFWGIPSTDLSFYKPKGG